MERNFSGILREIAKKNFGYLSDTYKNLMDAADKFDDLKQDLTDAGFEINRLTQKLDQAQNTIQTWIVSDKRYKELISLQAELKAKNQEIANLRNNKTH